MTSEKKVTVGFCRTVTSGLQVTVGLQFEKTNCNPITLCFVYFILHKVTGLQLNRDIHTNKKKGVNRSYRAVYGAFTVAYINIWLPPLPTVTCNLLRFGSVSHA